MRWRPESAALFGLFGLATLGAACASDSGADDGRLRVVASTPILADLARQLAGDDAEVFAVIPPGADTHGFAPSPDVARRVAEADVVVVNGYGLEGSTLEVILQNIDASAKLVVAAEGLAPLEGGNASG
ncbi:MAG: zinc ABC transporter substrate-binding protein, partial [Chloroflexi bacterium]|nr:zinc ABC transporter substrate-binding protein [Chloroflexota bacterium]